MKGWTYEQDVASAMQGWAIFQTTGAGHELWEIQSIDCPDDDDAVFLENDQAAHEFVRRQAETGDSLALAALEFLKEHSPKEFATITQGLHKNWT